jgi:ATP-dependent Clp protease ATP-binding subunit ClpA
MDNGRLTDHHGKTVDFRNVILIMTTNAGASDMAREGLGFGNNTREGEDEEAIKRMFTPEFRNRLDAIVPFSYLPTEVVARVVDKFILQLELQLADRNVHIDLDDEARKWLTSRGYDKLYGARPMGRLVQEKIKQPLAEELLFGKLIHGGEVKVTIKDDAPVFEIVPAAPKASKKRGKKAEPEAEQSQPEGDQGASEAGQPEEGQPEQA